jgi:hypothetical protein
MIEVEYIDNGKRVIIPAEVWEALKEPVSHEYLKADSAATGSQ